MLMNIPTNWLYPKSVNEAILMQTVMAKELITEDAFDPPQCIGGMDVSNFLFDPNKMIYACCVVLSARDMKVVEKSQVVEKQVFPYIPGLLGFREAPGLIRAFSALKQKPDLIMIDGHGI